MSSKKATIADIAQATGFSPATISRAMNHRHLVSEKTYETIINTMQSLEYEIPATNTVINDSSEKRILVVNVMDPTNAFYEKIYKGITTSANNHGWCVMVNQDPINANSYSHFVNVLGICNAIGLITFGIVEQSILDSLSDMLPVVQCCEFNPNARAPYIGVDNFSATTTLMEYLISRNHQKIALINGPMNLESERERQRAYEISMRRANLPIDPQLVINLPRSDYFMAHTSVTQLFHARNTPDAIFAVSDTLAYAAVVAAKEFGLNVPSDISVIGFDNVNLSEMCVPKLTTVNQPGFEIGFLGSESIYKQHINSPDRYRSSLLATELILRESSRR